jgi:HEAT repeat protein
MDPDSRAFTRESVVETFLVKACLAASELGDPATRPLLEKLREADPSMKVRSAAIDALHELGPS